MALAAPPPPLSSATTIPQLYTNGIPTATNNILPPPQPSTSPTSSIIMVIIIVSSAVIVSASIYLLIRFFSRRRTSFSPADDVVLNNRNGNENGQVRQHVITFDNNNNAFEKLPLFPFSSLAGKINGGDCAVCLSKFEPADQLRLLPICCHAFHAPCIDAWLKSNQTCPLCRSTVNPTEAEVMSKILSAAGGGGGNRSNSFRIEIGSISRRLEPSDLGQRTYSIGQYEYIIDDGFEIPVESTHRRGISADKDSSTEPQGENLAAEIGSGRRNWLRDYVDRVSVSLSSRTQSFRGSGRFFTGSSRRSDAVVDFDTTHSRIGEEISELFRWFSGV